MGKTTWLRMHPATTTHANLTTMICVQLVYKKAVLKGLKMGLSNAESTTDSWATGPSAGLAIRFLGPILTTASIVITNLYGTASFSRGFNVDQQLYVGSERLPPKQTIKVANEGMA